MKSTCVCQKELHSVSSCDHGSPVTRFANSIMKRTIMVFHEASGIGFQGALTSTKAALLPLSSSWLAPRQWPESLICLSKKWPQAMQTVTPRRWPYLVFTLILT